MGQISNVNISKSKIGKEVLFLCLIDIGKHVYSHHMSLVHKYGTWFLMKK